MKREHTLDIVYVVRQGENNEQLRYSLRSLKNLPHGNVFITGFCPEWVTGVIKLERDQTDLPELHNVNENIKLALADKRLSADFVFMNDDFYIMKPTEEIPVQHQGLLDDRIAGYMKTVPLQAYSLTTTRRELYRLDKGPYLYSYELHTPMVFNKRKLKKLYGLVEEPLFAIRPRTLYGNYYSIKGEKSHDVKTGQPLQQQFQSTPTEHGPTVAWAYIRSTFPTPSPYELHVDIQVPQRKNANNKK